MRRVLCDMPIAAVSWGSGGFTVQQAGALSLANVAVAGQITVQGGGSLSVSGGSLNGGLPIQAGSAQAIQLSDCSVPSDSAPTLLALDAQSLRLSGVTASDQAWRVDRAENAAYVFTVTGHGSNSATTTIRSGQVRALGFTLLSSGVTLNGLPLALCVCICAQSMQINGGEAGASRVLYISCAALLRLSCFSVLLPVMRVEVICNARAIKVDI